MSLVLAFDLDDTLYDERRFVESGFRAVAADAERRFGWRKDESFVHLCAKLDADGRGAIFDGWLAEHGRLNKSEVRRCVRIYRSHTPHLRPFPAAQELLPILARCHPLYLVTDGNKLVQRRKIEALGIAGLFRKVFVTHQYGVAHAKPSPRCFEHIREREGCTWDSMVYVGDNPAKDFVALNRRGGHTIRVLTGSHRHAHARAGYDAEFTISGLADLPAVLEGLQDPARIVTRKSARKHV